jgi:hypothetical protein
MSGNYGQSVTGTGITRYEKVLTTDGGDGKWHYIDRQNLGNNCGPSCVQMVSFMVTGKRIGQVYLNGLVGLSEAGVSVSDSSALGAVGQGHDFQATGTINDHLIQALKDCKVDKAREPAASTTDWGAVWRACSEKAPGIMCIKWAGSTAAHFVVVAGPLAGQAGKILILDPAYGVQQLDLATPTVYNPRQGGGNAGLILATGNLDVSPGNWVNAVITY